MLKIVTALCTCQGCNGVGHHKYPALRPISCEVCKGTGQHMSGAVWTALCILTIVSVLPVIWLVL